MVSASQMPQIRDDLVSLCSSDWIGTLIGHHLLRDGDIDLPLPETEMEFGAAMAAYQRRLANLAEAATLYRASSEMVAVADSARRTMPGYRLHPEDLPAERGLIVFDKPISYFDPQSENLSEWDRRNVEESQRAGTELPPVAVVGALWGPAVTHDGRPGVLVVMWADTSRLVEYWERNHETGGTALRQLGALSYHDETVLPFGHEYDPGAGPDQAVRHEALGVLMCTWLLMGQPIVSSDPEPLPRQTRRALQRKGRAIPDVRVVKLRQPTRPKPTNPDPTRTYRNRWFVTGHWRRQWYPSRNDHRPIYVPAHIKGPEGAPIIVPERVYDWKR